MRTNNSGLLVLLLLILALVLAVPLLFLFSYYSPGPATLPALSSHTVTIAATAGLFIIPVLFVYLAAIILAAKTRRAGPARVHYPWENDFPDVVKEPELLRAKVSRVRAADKKIAAKGTHVGLSFDIKAVLAVAIVILLLVGLVFWSQRMSGPFSYKSDVSKANASVEENATQLQPEKTGNSPARKPLAVPDVAGAAKNFGIKITGWFRNLAAGAVHSIQELPAKVWLSIAAAALVVILVAALFYSNKTGQLGEIGNWLKDIAGWLGTIPAAIRGNFAKKIMPAILMIVAIALVAGYVFRKWLGANLPGFASVANNLVNLPSMARDFILVYRLYILIGIFTLVAVIGFLMTVERRGKGKNQPEANAEKQQKNSAPVASKKKNGRK